MALTNVPALDRYFEAFAAKDLAACMACFSEPALIEFGPTMCSDRKALEKWHQERWKNNMRVVNIDVVAAVGDMVTVEGAVASDRLKFWKLNTLAVRARFRLADDKISEARFGIRS